MSQVEFFWNGERTIIQCDQNEKMEEIIKKYLTKLEKTADKINFLYGGGLLDLKLTFEEIASTEDKRRKRMCILVNGEEDENEDFLNSQKSKNIICPECKENIRILIKDYRISLYDCKNGHRKDNILLDKFENTQYIDESKIICEICKDNNKSLTFGNKFFICTKCKINICPLCKDNHNKEHGHDIIDYGQKDFICNLHNENYNSYCENCKKDICLMCEKQHANHKLISYGGIVHDNKYLKERLNTFRNKINEFKNDIKDIMTNLNNLMENLDIYYSIYENMIINYDQKKRNYPILQNINDMDEINKFFIENINEIINDKDIKNKFNDMIDIYYKMINMDKDQSQIPKNKIQLNETSNDNSKELKNNIEKFDKSEKNLKVSNDNYDNFKINEIKELQSFNIPIDENDDYKIKIYDMLVLKDNRILLYICYDFKNIKKDDDNNKKKTFYKLIIYNPMNNDICNVNINISISKLNKMIQIDDNKIMILVKKSISLIDINRSRLIQKRNIIEQSNIDKIEMIILSDQKIAIFYKKQHSLIYEIYSYEDGKLNFIKSKEVIDRTFEYIPCKITENEVALSIWNDALGGMINFYYIMFYDVKKDKKIKTILTDSPILNVSLINKDNLVVYVEKQLILIDVNKKWILKRISLEYFDILIPLNEKIFLIIGRNIIYQYIIKNGKCFLNEGKNEIEFGIIKKYINNKIIVENKGIIKIYG